MNTITRAVPAPTHREVIGYSLDSLEIGKVFEHQTRRTLQDFDNATLSLLSMNTHPAHIDYEYAAGTQFGRPLVVSPLLVSSLSAIVFNDLRQVAVAGFEIQSLRFIKPVFPGETISATSRVLARDAASVRMQVAGYKAGDRQFCEFLLVLALVPER